VVRSNGKFDQETPQKATSTDCQADTILSPVERVASDCNTCELTKDNLHDESEDQNTQEEEVVKEICKHVQIVAQLAAVDLVEHLHKHKCLEHHRVDDSLVFFVVVTIGILVVCQEFSVVIVR
jgi:hypothetical protein